MDVEYVIVKRNKSAAFLNSMKSSPFMRINSASSNKGNEL